MSPPAQDPSSAPPGWYPDPWAPGGVRWWSGTGWTSYAGPAGPAYQARPTDGYAVASVITSGVGLSPVGIVLGLIAKRRIRQAGGARDGGGLATVGIALGCVFLAMTIGVAVLAVSGTFDQVNSDDYSGEEARVAHVVDRFEDAFEEADGNRICRELFTPALARDYAADGGCESVWGEQSEAGWAEIDIQTLAVNADGSATATADDEGGEDDWTFTLARDPRGEWRICGVE